MAQEQFRETPQYIVTHQWGPPHQRNFRAESRVMVRVLGAGAGCSKKEAEQEAASQALSKNEIISWQ